MRFCKIYHKRMKFRRNSKICEIYTTQEMTSSHLNLFGCWLLFICWLFVLKFVIPIIKKKLSRSIVLSVLWLPVFITLLFPPFALRLNFQIRYSFISVVYEEIANYCLMVCFNNSEINFCWRFTILMIKLEYLLRAIKRWILEKINS